MMSSLAFGPALVVMITTTPVLAGMVRGVIGMGLPTVAMGILGSLISPVAAAAMLLLLSLIGDLFQFSDGRNARQLLRRLWPVLLTIMATTLLAGTWIIGGGTTRTQFALGVALVAYAIWTLMGEEIAVVPQREEPCSLVIGFVTGLLADGTGVFVMPTMPWIQSLDFKKDELIQTLGISFTFSTLALALDLQQHSALPIQSLSLSTLAIFPALIGQWIDIRVRRVISPLMFKHCFLFCLVGLGTEVTLRTV